MERKVKWLLGGGLAAGFVLAGGLRYLAKERATPEPPHLTVREEGPFAIRDYAAIWVAETVAYGDRRDAIRSGFRTLSDYIFGHSHDGDTIDMTVPVIEEADGEGRWRIRFVMPDGETPDTLPEPPPGVTLKQLPATRVGVVEFSGRPEEVNMGEQEARLRRWLHDVDTHDAADKPLYAFYSSPAVPGPMRRNEVWLPIPLEPPVAT
ncbi:SOUL family heme-binding protein [Sphingomicrobium sediminis]|uniref:Heme-binding protein n=1 Tax=Sphingomicrobium sediminis TaxID=2950949 RepID=A0A9X2J2C2_9SPHN|nr:heme-binding protein [Sphingomicrobium sediminis]MCM8558128.1 heme-binding protein [Sphingomicrobium sediminis]